jgi:arylsulfatase A-like enzyme
MRWCALQLIIVIVCVSVFSVSKTIDADDDGTHVSKLSMNVILITISSLRADHVSCLGYARDTTPNFDAFAGENILFRNAFATSGWMMPAHGSIFTSLYPTLHGATHIDKSLGDEHFTLAEILADNGFYCVGFCCNPRLDREHGFAQGFNLYDDYSVSVMLESLAFEDKKSVDINTQRTNALINDAAIRWLQNNTHRPFFMFIHYYDNHWDYLPPPPNSQRYDPDYDGPIDGTQIAREPLFSNPPSERDIQHIIALYDGEVRQTDNDLGDILNALEDTGLSDNSIIIIMGDHGEQFYEHGHTSHHGIYEELIHIPLAISIPGVRARSKTIDSLVSQVDILPTILDYLQITAPEQYLGKSLRPLIEMRKKSINEYILAEYTGGAVPDCYAVRSIRYKYCQEAGSEAFGYNLTNDPGEQKRIVLDSFPKEIETLEENLNRFIKATGTRQEE